MMHCMRLNKEPFRRIMEGEQTIEVRLFDEKRQKLQVGDDIEFSMMDSPEERFTVKIVGLFRFPSFRDLYSSLDPRMLGHPEGIGLEEQLSRIRKYYSEDEEIKYGVLGIQIRVIS
jgi:ASC-1-like (ASCH) protein